MKERWPRLLGAILQGAFLALLLVAVLFVAGILHADAVLEFRYTGF